jgi:hypothetical protein
MPCLGWFGAGRPRFRANLPCWTGCGWFKLPHFVMTAAATANRWVGLIFLAGLQTRGLHGIRLIVSADHARLAT